MAARRSKPRKAGRKPASRRPATRGEAKASRARAEPRAAMGSGLQALARKIVRATRQPQRFDLRDLYAEGVVSREATGAIATGLAELEAKLAGWSSMQERSEWVPRRVFTEGNAICIEWDATVWMRDGRVLPFSEVAVHEVRDGKIVAERYYYDPLPLSPGPA